MLSIIDYGDYSSGGGGSSSGGFRDSRKTYEEYDACDDDTSVVRRSNSLNVSGSTSSPVPRRSATTAPTPTSAKPAAPAPIVDLLGMDDNFSAPTPAAQPATVASFDSMSPLLPLYQSNDLAMLNR